MAEGFARHYGGELVEAYSAGSNPQQIHPMTIEVMDEVGIDLSKHYAKGLSEAPSAPDFVITVCDPVSDTCPLFTGEAKFLQWSFDDPAAVIGSREERLAVFRRVRDEIKVRVNNFLAELHRDS